jgi:hypothetical protein
MPKAWPRRRGKSTLIFPFRCGPYIGICHAKGQCAPHGLGLCLPFVLAGGGCGVFAALGAGQVLVMAAPLYSKRSFC